MERQGGDAALSAPPAAPAPTAHGAQRMARSYYAFISYSHRDEVFARWLHRALETYRVPRALIGRETPMGTVPRRLMPVFRDRDELVAADSLHDTIEAALAVSRSFIVLCSPAAATSHWVDLEIRRYATLHGWSGVFAAVIDGVPRAADPALEAFPPALLEDREPVAADFRPGHDGRRLGLVKLIAGSLGVGLDDIVRREATRRQRRTAAIVGASLTGMALTSSLALVAIGERRAAERERDQAEGLIEYMLTDLRQKLEPVGRLEVLDGVGQRALRYYAEQDADRIRADALGRRARAQHLIGEVKGLRGDNAGALAAFAQAAATTRTLLERDPGDGQRIFDHAQSVFWVGYTAWQKGDAQTAEARFRDYKRLADRLVALDPRNADWVAERVYASTNLGIALMDGGRFNEAAREFSIALSLSEKAVDAEPADQQRRYSLGEALAWYADAQFRRGALREAVALRDRQERLYRAILQRDGSNARAKDGLYRSLGSKALVLYAIGDGQRAMVAQAESLGLVGEISRLDPDNADLAGMYGRTLAAQLELGGTVPDADLERSVDLARKAWRAAPADRDRLATFVRLKLATARQELELRAPERALAHAAEVVAAIEDANRLRRSRDSVTGLYLGMAEILEAEVQARGHNRREAMRHAARAESAIRTSTVEVEPRARLVLMESAVLRGDVGTAAEHRRQLDAIEFRPRDLTNALTGEKVSAG